MNKKRMLLAACLVSAASWASAQVRVTGTVVSAEDGQPVVGASVIVPGTKVGVTTDTEGHFMLRVPEGKHLLRVSYLGMDPQEIAAKENVKVVLQANSKNLNELVVVGYGSGQKLGTVVGAVAKVGAEKIDNKPTTDVLDALQGQIAGLNIYSNTGDPGDGTTGISAYIRGVGSLSAGVSPLFVVDGTPASSDVFRMLNSNDIASVTVLKDASATSIYGSRAANGVIYITTKKGSFGQAAQVQFSQTFGWSSLARDVAPFAMHSDELLDWQLKSGIITQKAYDGYKANGTDIDWQDFFFDKNVPMTQTNFSIRGGNSRFNYYTSASFYKEKGLIPGSKFQRGTFRTNIDAKPLDWLRYGVNINVTFDKRRASMFAFQGSNYSQGPILGTILYAPYAESPYNEDGTPKNYLTVPGIGSNFPSMFYVESGNYSNKTDLQTNSSAFIELTPVKGLTLKSQLGLEAADYRGSAKVYASYAADRGITPYNQQAFTRSASWTMTNTAEYKFNVADLHDFTILLGQEGIRYDSYGFTAKVNNQINDKLMMLSNGTSADLSGTSDSQAAYRFLSFFGRVDYALASKYFANITVRNDQSSRFGNSNRSAWFVSGGLMWDMKKEAFLADADWLNSLQFRASVGSTGNASIPNYEHLALSNTTNFGGVPGLYISQLGNETLGWEKTVQSNVGFSATLLNRFTIDLTYYLRNTSNMLMEVPVPATTGFSTQWQNVGSMRNQGIELSLSADVIKTRDFLLSLRANYSYNANKITKIFYDLQEWPMPNNLVSYNVGKSLDYYMPVYAGVDKTDGAPMWYLPGHNDGIQHDFNPETMSKDYDQGSLSQDTGKKRFAPHYGGFGLTASYKGLTLNADFSYVLGKYMVNNDYFFADNPAQFGGVNQSRDVLNSWENPGDITDEPGVEYPRQFDTHLLENASFLRLKNLSLSYDFPKQWLAATRFIKNFRLIFTGRNLLTATKYRGADPEIDTNITYGAYPSTRQFTIGGEITF